MLEVRPIRDDEEEQLSLDVYNAVWPLDSVTLVESRSFLERTIDHVDLLARLDGVLAGSATVARLPSRPDVGFALVTVLPEQRGRGVGSALYETASTWLAERGIAELDAVVPEDDEASLDWARRRSFREVERNSHLVLELRDHEPQPVEAPQGIEIVTWAERPEVAHGLYEVACEAFPDIPGGEDELMEPYEDWLAHHMQRAGDLPETTFVALADGEVVGYAKLTLSGARPRDAGHEMTAVRRAWRGRGIAGALKRAQITWAKRAGYERLMTQNEVRNEPIRRLNEQLGYRTVPGRVYLRGPRSGPR
jgi:GNAT superfamily N-acetyltransferase